LESAVSGVILDVADNLLPSIGSVIVRGLTGQAYAYESSDIAAWKPGSVTVDVKDVNPANGSVKFGLAGHSSKLCIRRVGATVAYRGSNLAGPISPLSDPTIADKIEPGDYVLRLV